MQEESRSEELTDAEMRALDHLRTAGEHLRRARAQLLGFHHGVGRGMNRYEDAVGMLLNAGRDEIAAMLYDPTARGVLDGRWSWNVVDEASEELFTPVLRAEREIRAAIRDGTADRRGFVGEGAAGRRGGRHASPSGVGVGGGTADRSRHPAREGEREIVRAEGGDD